MNQFEKHIDEYRVIFYIGNSFYRSWAASRDEALLRAIDNGSSGITITWENNTKAPTSWRYFLLVDDIRGVSRKEFYETVGGQWT